MPKLEAPPIKEETQKETQSIKTPSKPQYTPEQLEKRKQLEHYMELIWKGDYSVRGSIEVIWRLFNEPKKQR